MKQRHTSQRSWQVARRCCLARARIETTQTRQHAVSMRDQTSKLGVPLGASLSGGLRQALCKRKRLPPPLPTIRMAPVPQTHCWAGRRAKSLQSHMAMSLTMPPSPGCVAPRQRQYWGACAIPMTVMTQCAQSHIERSMPTWSAAMTREKTSKLKEALNTVARGAMPQACCLDHGHCARRVGPARSHDRLCQMEALHETPHDLKRMCTETRTHARKASRGIKLANSRFNDSWAA